MATSFDLGGLLGNAFGSNLSSLNDLLTDEQRAAIQRQAGLSAAAALLQAAGPSTTPTSLGQALGSAFTAGQTGLQKGTESALTQMLTRQKLDEAKRARDLQSRISEIIGGVTPQQAQQSAAAGPQMSAAEQQADVYRRLSNVYAASGKPEDANRYLDMAEKLAPSRQEVIGEPIKTTTGWVQRTKTGSFIQLPKDFQPVSKAVGEPQLVTEKSTGRQVLVQRYEDGTFQTIEAFGPPRKLERVDTGGRIEFVDMSTVSPGTALAKTLAPQVVGGAESGYYVVGGGRGGVAAPSAAPAASGAAAAPRAPSAGAASAPAAAPGAPAPVTTGLQPIIPGTGKAFQNEKDMRSEFTTAVKPYVELSQAFQKIESAAKNPSGAGDISLVYGYMKVLDPGSVVREGEFATAANAGGVPDAVRSMYNRALSGQRLSENVRADFLNQARGLIESQRVLSDDIVQRYTDLAKQYNLNAERVVFDPFKRIEKQQARPAAQEGATATDRQGRPIVYRNGQWVYQ